MSNDEPESASTWFAYIERNPGADWYNGYTYVDTMNTKATEHFLQMTHEAFKKALPGMFGNVVPSIFTDEPQVEHKALLAQSDQRSDCLLPWSPDLGQTFRAEHGYDILDRLPEFLWDTTSPTNLETRYHFHDHVSERFVSGFLDRVGDWCGNNGIVLTGHMMMEQTLQSQTTALGEAMRCYRNMQMPGIDLLCDQYEYTTAKQATSVARQTGASGAVSEIYGVTNWTFDFVGHKGCGDWQAALGITLRVHHLSPVTLVGEAKRDYPAAINYQSPWYREYKLVEDYFARVAVALTRGKAVTRVAVIHPVESFWLCFGPQDRNGEEQRFRNKAHEDLARWLLHGLIDFDFISESLFASQTSPDAITSARLPVGECAYDAVVLPCLRTIRQTTLDRLRAFAEKGGRVIFAGGEPSLIDARPPSTQSGTLISGSEHTEFTEYHIIKALEPHRDVRLRSRSLPACTSLLYQLRRDGSQREGYLFLCNTDRVKTYATTVSVRGTFDVIVLDAIKGEEWRLKQTSVSDGWTHFDWTFEGCASLLVRLVDRESSSVAVNVASGQQLVYHDSFKRGGFVQLDSVTLSEQNVLLLDRAEYCVVRNDGKGDPNLWHPEVEVLRIDNLARALLMLPPKSEGIRQPWAHSPEERKPVGTLKLRFRFDVEAPVSSPVKLAVEKLENVTILLDGDVIPSKRSGWWVDEGISTVELAPSLSKGSHELILEIQFSKISSLERVYLLGGFHVQLRGHKALMMGDLDLSQVAFGDWTVQGLPFYAGNVSYHCSLTVPCGVQAGSELALQIPQIAGPVATVALEDPNGKEPSIVAFPPRVAPLGQLEPGKTFRVTVTSFGNRENAFGAIHVPPNTTNWFGPDAWRTEHEWWMDEYNVKKMGILSRPVLLVPGKEIYTQNRPKQE